MYADIVLLNAVVVKFINTIQIMNVEKEVLQTQKSLGYEMLGLSWFTNGGEVKDYIVSGYMGTRYLKEL